MAWSDYVPIMQQVGKALFPDSKIMGTLGDIAGIVGAIQQHSTAQDETEAYRQRHDAALGNQTGIAQQLANQSIQQAQQNAILRERLLQQTTALGARLNALNTQLDPIPTIDPAVVHGDANKLAAQGMQDFYRLVGDYGAAQEARNLSRLGGAYNPTLDSIQEYRAMQKFGQIPQQIRATAYQDAVNRHSAMLNLMNANRQAQRGDITGTLGPQMNAELSLMQNIGTGASTGYNAANIYGSVLNSYDRAGTAAATDETQAFNDLMANINQTFGLEMDKLNQPNTQQTSVSPGGIPIPQVKPGVEDMSQYQTGGFNPSAPNPLDPSSGGYWIWAPGGRV